MHNIYICRCELNIQHFCLNLQRLYSSRNTFLHLRHTKNRLPLKNEAKVLQKDKLKNNIQKQNRASLGKNNIPDPYVINFSDLS